MPPGIADASAVGNARVAWAVPFGDRFEIFRIYCVKRTHSPREPVSRHSGFRKYRNERL